MNTRFIADESGNMTDLRAGDSRQFDIVRKKANPLDLTRAETVRETIETFDFSVGHDGTILFFDEGGLGVASFVAGSWLEVKEVR